jgi:hypothetical protein
VFIELVVEGVVFEAVVFAAYQLTNSVLNEPCALALAVAEWKVREASR